MKATLFETLICCLGITFTAQPGATQSAGRITKAELGTGVTEQYEIVNPATEFSPDTAKIVCVWKAEGILKGTSVRGVRIADRRGGRSLAGHDGGDCVAEQAD